jgi:hypothetical protein
MGVRRKALNRPPITDPSVDAQWIAEKYSVSYDTGLRWIDKLTKKYITYTDGRFKKEKRGSRLRRIPMSVLDAHIDETLH